MRATTDADNSGDERSGDERRDFDWARDVPIVVGKLPFSPRYCASVLKAMTDLGLFPERPTHEALERARQASRDTAAQQMAIRVAGDLRTTTPSEIVEAAN